MNTHTLADNKSGQQSQTRYERVMLIDDNSMDNFINKKLMETHQFSETVVSFENPFEALAHIKKSSTAQLPDLIFLDINMPNMNGFEFLEAFEKLSAEIHERCKIIMLSTSESFKDLNRANKNPFVKKFLNKPLSSPVLNAIKV